MKTTVDVPGGKSLATETLSVSGEPRIKVPLDGETVIPEGKPVTWTETWDEKPSIAVAVIPVIADWPAGIETGDEVKLN